jgi:glutathione synthase/RimK-type ligase-like ATP-grasp enzyme
MSRVKAIILRNEIENDHNLWVKACEEYSDKIGFRIVNLTKNDWYEKIIEHESDILLAKPGDLNSGFKQLYDERIYILEKVLGFKVYPSADEIFLFENKRFLSYWLKVNKLPYPRTNIFYHKEEAIDFARNSDFPVVAKINIGASGSGVKILKNENELLDYINDAFSAKGVTRRWGPNFSKKGIFKRGFHYITNPSDISDKLDKYRNVKNNTQKGFVIFQEYINHQFEWRIVVIGDSYFAHKKIKIGEKASGSLIKNYDNPPLYILDFARNIIGKFKFNSMAIDVFERSNEDILINEMQCIFGQSDPYQMKVNGKAGRYKYIGNKWKFEEGDFNGNESYNLRIESILSDLNNTHYL